MIEQNNLDLDVHSGNDQRQATEEIVPLRDVREKAERNLANKRVLEIIAEAFNVSVKKVRIINGHQSPSKILAVDFPESLV
jgi:uncharacterized protein YggU (UPF0235/DUF167 family)